METCIEQRKIFSVYHFSNVFLTVVSFQAFSVDEITSKLTDSLFALAFLTLQINFGNEE